ncbi:PepSY domain-containing protein [Virgibacillus kekensis]|uniref:PepSY domain-containing protein n=1 Tax=Virgibacillus kekensis TaxID=202261 RepID=A0ABV9DEA7_9BACI
MNWKKVAIATGIGVAVGYLAKQQIDNYQTITPEKALKHAKETFKKQGPISGSWIYMKPEEVEKNGLLYNAYRGGVTRNIDGENKQYEFYVDVDTGAVIGAVQTA